MATVQSSPIDIGSSPRSTVLGGTGHMTTNLASMNDSNMATGIANGEKVTPPSSTEGAKTPQSQPDPAAISEGKSKRETEEQGKEKLEGREEPELSPSHTDANAPLPSQPGVQPTGYYLGYPQHNGTPPSPTVSAHPVTQLPYDAAIGSFIQQPGTFATAHTSPFGVPNPGTPLSPPRATVTAAGMVSVPPASPLFPRVNSNGLDSGGLVAAQQVAGVVAPQSPSLPYMSPALGSYATTRTQTVGSSDEGNWDRNQNNHGYPSPQLGTQGMMPYIMPRTGQRTYSFDGESMLPPAALDPQDQSNPAYSPYSAGHSSPAGAAIFSQQQPWNYPGPPDMYSTPGSPLQPRPTAHPQMNMYAPAGASMGGGMRHMGAPYGHPHQFYPSSSPGPPIQTTASNKGPDGANLFIFHIPNHFTNVDMYNLFCHYGNLLSVRIMVEKDTGRSRGFGFVSYDNPESAAHAIKELNGYTIGNKRLKVQHKQIRPRDLQERDGAQGGYGHGEATGGAYGRSAGSFSSPLPPSGQNTQNLWYDSQAGPGVATTAVGATVANTADAMANVPEDGDLANPVPGDEMPARTSPLANLGTLQSALPDVSGTTPGE